MNHSNKPNLVIIGPSGGGKGTQAKMIAEKYGLRHISMGVVFRSEMKKGTAYGKEVEDYMNRGEFVPTTLVFKGLAPILELTDYHGFILDGFPRIPDQSKALQDLLAEFKVDLDAVFHLDIKPEVIMARRKADWAKGKSFYKEGARSDETEESIKNRLAEYEKNIEPILAFYQNKGILHRVNGERPIKDIFKDIVKTIDKQVLRK